MRGMIPWRGAVKRLTQPLGRTALVRPACGSAGAPVLSASALPSPGEAVLLAADWSSPTSTKEQLHQYGPQHGALLESASPKSPAYPRPSRFQARRGRQQAGERRKFEFQDDGRPPASGIPAKALSASVGSRWGGRAAHREFEATGADAPSRSRWQAPAGPGSSTTGTRPKLGLHLGEASAGMAAQMTARFQAHSRGDRKRRRLMTGSPTGPSTEDTAARPEYLPRSSAVRPGTAVFYCCACRWTGAPAAGVDNGYVPPPWRYWPTGRVSGFGAGVVEIPLHNDCSTPRSGCSSRCPGLRGRAWTRSRDGATPSSRSAGGERGPGPRWIHLWVPTGFLLLVCSRCWLRRGGFPGFRICAAGEPQVHGRPRRRLAQRLKAVGCGWQVGAARSSAEALSCRRDTEPPIIS